MRNKLAIFTKCNFLVLISGMYQHTSEGRRFCSCDENITKHYRIDCYFTYKHQSWGRYQYVFRIQVGIGNMENGFLREPLTTRSRVLVQKLRGSHLTKNFPAFCARKAITSYLQPNNPFPLHQFWFFHLRLGLPSGLPTHISSSNLCIDFSPRSVPHAPPISSSLFDHPCVSGEEYKPRSPFVYSSLSYCYVFPLRPKYSPRHLVIQHTQSVFFSLRKIASFTPI